MRREEKFLLCFRPLSKQSQITLLVHDRLSLGEHRQLGESSCAACAETAAFSLGPVPLLNVSPAQPLVTSCLLCSLVTVVSQLPAHCHSVCCCQPCHSVFPHFRRSHVSLCLPDRLLTVSSGYSNMAHSCLLLPAPAPCQCLLLQPLFTLSPALPSPCHSVSWLQPPVTSVCLLHAPVTVSPAASPVMVSPAASPVSQCLLPASPSSQCSPASSRLVTVSPAAKPLSTVSSACCHPCHDVSCSPCHECRCCSPCHRCLIAAPVTVVLLLQHPVTVSPALPAPARSPAAAPCHGLSLALSQAVSCSPVTRVLLQAPVTDVSCCSPLLTVSPACSPIVTGCLLGCSHCPVFLLQPFPVVSCLQPLSRCSPAAAPVTVSPA
ncbi:keratin-associated protein 10-6-like [Peromyscus leucopus]|uniref:keratin-associated protein 10-6-like n=1 Tax=Peromyscus leucopus TaxID=10041 RepID=UPI001884EDC3|nr:keratin-associated protein 10-6-like [Peromyscus leucopus]